MANGFNKTGVPNSDFYSLGRGRLFGAALDANDKPISWRDLGNCPEFATNLEVETLEHQSSREGLRTTDKEITIAQTVNLSLTLDHIEFDNLALFFGAAKAENTFAAVTIGTPVVALNGLDADEYLKGRWFDLLDNTGKRVYSLLSDGSGAGPDLDVQVDDSAGFGSPTGLTIAAGDILFDKVMGRVFVTHNGTNTAPLSGNVWLRYSSTTPVNAAKDIMELRLFQVSSTPLALKFIAENPANADVQTEWVFHKVSLRGDGDYNLISEEFSTLPLTGVAESAPLADADSPLATVRTYTDAGV